MVLVSVEELYDLGCILVEMSLVIRVDGDLSFWKLEFADVDAYSTGVLPDEVNEIWQVVSQVFRFIKFGEESFLF